MMMNEIWNKRIDCGSRTYFFDMKETKEGKKSYNYGDKTS